MHRSLHWKRLLVLIVVLLILGGGLFALNRVQARRQSSIVKDVALKASDDINGDPERLASAITHWETYLKFQSNDEDAGLKYTKLLLDQYKANPTSKTAIAAVTGLESVLRKFPNHHPERRQLIEIYIKIGNIRSAREHLDVLFKSPQEDFKNDIELLEMASVCEEVSGETSAALKFLEDAIQTDKAPVRVYQKILLLLNGNKADGLRESKIANHIRTLKEKERFRDNLEARIAIARFELFRREFQNAKVDIDYAAKLPGGEKNSEVLLAAAEWEISGIHKSADMKPKLAAARVLLERALAADPTNVQVGLFLAEILVKLGERNQALNTLRETSKAFGPINEQYWYLIDYLIDLREQELSTSLVERGAAGGKIDARLIYLRGRLAMLNNDYQLARKLFEESAPDLVKLPNHHKRAMLGLGIIYGILENPDQQLVCFRNALRDDGSYLLAIRGEADALNRLGHLEEAINRYQTLVTAFQIVELRPALARMRFLDIVRKPAEKRNWTKFDSDDTLGPPGERTAEIQILAAQGLAARGEKGKAIEILKEVLKKDKDNPLAASAWIALARIQEAGKPEAALLVIEDAQKQIGDTVDLRLARADVLIYRAKPPTVAEINALGTPNDKFRKADLYRLYFGLGQACINAINRFTQDSEKKLMQDLAIRFLKMASEADPASLYCRSVLIDVALASERRDIIESCIDEIAKLEGPNGPISTLGRVCIRIPEIKKIQNEEERRSLIRELREQTKKVQLLRQGWGRVYVALGRLDEAEGLNEQAVEHYRQAINEGDRDEAVIRKTVSLYRERKQDGLAAGLLDELATKMTLPEDLERFRAIYEMLNRVVPRSERLTIERIAPVSSLDSRILLLRGSLLAAIRDDEGALKAFRRAIELAEDNPDTWESLIRQLTRIGDMTAAKKAMAEAERKLLAIPAKSEVAQAQLYISLGECQELCNDMTAAGERYQKALRIAPKELIANRRMVEFLLRIGQQGEADKLLYKLINDPAQDLARWARRYLAKFSLMSRPDAYQQRTAALALIAKNLAAAPDDPEDIKARAVILTVDPATREEGVRVLKDYWARGELTPDESYHLGLLIYGLGPSKIAESVKYFETAAKPRPEVTTEHVAGLIKIYTAWDRLDLAEATLERLKAVAPYSWETTREQSRLLMKKSRIATLRGDRDEGKKLADQAQSAILKFNGHDSADMIRTKSGPLLVELGFYADAEVLYRKLITLSDSPTAHTPLALLYIQTKKTSEAIKLAREFEAKSPVLLTAQILSGAVRVKRPGAAVENEVKTWLDDKIARYAGKPELAGLLGARAELYDAQENYKEAVSEYRRSIKEGLTDFTANNLSMLLALTDPGHVDEAIQMMTKIIDLRGPVPTYLDTRAVAYIVKGGEENIEKAIQDLTMARLQNPRAVYAYHLAWAYDLQQKRGNRDKLLDEALTIGIGPDDLHPRERDKYRELFSRYAK